MRSLNFRRHLATSVPIHEEVLGEVSVENKAKMAGYFFFRQVTRGAKYGNGEYLSSTAARTLREDELLSASSSSALLSTPGAIAEAGMWRWRVESGIFGVRGSWGGGGKTKGGDEFYFIFFFFSRQRLYTGRRKVTRDIKYLLVEKVEEVYFCAIIFLRLMGAGGSTLSGELKLVLDDARARDVISA